jgi:PAS domain S-box-containing protein
MTLKYYNAVEITQAVYNITILTKFFIRECDGNIMEGKTESQGIVIQEEDPALESPTNKEWNQGERRVDPRRSLQVLFVDDEPAICDVSRIFLERQGDIEVATVCSAADALAALQGRLFDAIVCDYQLHDEDGIAFLKRIRREGNETPFIVFTGRGREEIAIEALNSGADFYLQKGGDPKSQFAELAHFIRRASSQREAEQRLLESERKYRHVVEDQTEFISRFLPDGTHVFVNEAYLRYFGKSREEMLGQVFRPEIYPDDRKLVASFFASLTPEHPVDFVEHRIIMPDGSVRWQRWSDRAIFDDKGEVIEYQSVGRDVTDRREAVEALERSERRLHAIVRGSPIATFVIDQHHRVISWNHALEVYSGISAEKIVGTHDPWRAFYDKKRPCMADLLVDGAVDRIHEWYPGKFARSALVENAYEAIDFFPRMGAEGKWIYLTAAPIMDEKGAIIGAMETLEDITPRKRAEEELLKSERRFRELADLLPLVVFETDAQGMLSYVNRRAFEAFGCTEEEFRNGISIFQVIHEQDRERAKMTFSTIREGSHAEKEEFTAVRKNGSTFPLTVYISRVQHEKVFHGLRGVVIDVTEQKMMQEIEKRAFEQIEKNINQLSILNDHIRNPLAVIVGLADMEGGANGEKILAQAREIDRIITSLDMGWLESEKIREFMRKHYGVGETERSR